MDKYEKIGLYNEQINCYMSTVIHKKYIKICHKYYNAKIEYFKKLLNNLFEFPKNNNGLIPNPKRINKKSEYIIKLIV